MKIFIAIIMLCGLMTSAHTENTLTQSTTDILGQDSLCTGCHNDTEHKSSFAIYHSTHGKAGTRAPSCQACHGDSEAHMQGDRKYITRKSPDVTFIEKSKIYPPTSATKRNERCLACHANGLRNHWSGSAHQSQGIACNTCHIIHTPNDKTLTKNTQAETCFACHKGQQIEAHLLSTHPIQAGKIFCSDCHNPHGTAGAKLLVKNSINETCYSCHTEKRGPFLWQHTPVVEDCSICHAAHGSNNQSLLKQRLPRLCEECHTDEHVNTAEQNENTTANDASITYQLPASASLFPRSTADARACLNCHALIHGSNHAAGAKLNQ
jgi:DmsE family decaheme c-type cytochrome